MANAETITKDLDKKQPTTLESVLNQHYDKLAEVLPKHMDKARLLRIALSTIKQNPKLSQCTPVSFLGALFTSLSMGLEPVNGKAYIIPYNNSKIIDGQWVKMLEAEFQIGYKGLMELFYRHQKSISLFAHTVYEGDKFEYQYGLDKVLNHTPDGKKTKPTHYYCVAKLQGDTLFMVQTYDEIKDHAIQYSGSWDKTNKCFYKNSSWNNHFDSMAKKTVLIELMKTMPLSIELQNAIANDGTIKSTIEPEMELQKDEKNWSE